MSNEKDCRFNLFTVETIFMKKTKIIFTGVYMMPKEDGVFEKGDILTADKYNGGNVILISSEEKDGKHELITSNDISKYPELEKEKQKIYLFPEIILYIKNQQI